MEIFKTYEKYGEKAYEPMKASYPIANELFKIFGKTTLLVLSAAAASSANNSLKQLGDFGLRYTLNKSQEAK